MICDRGVFVVLMGDSPGSGDVVAGE